MVHVSVLRATGNIDKIELYRPSVRRYLARHAGSISCVAIMREEQAVSVQRKHGDRIIRPSCSRHHMHESAPHGSQAERDLHELAFYVGLLRDGCHVTFPGTGKGF
jgi:hypothetical protein